MSNIESPSIYEFCKKWFKSSQEDSRNTSVKCIMLSNLVPFISVFIIPFAWPCNDSLSLECLNIYELFPKCLFNSHHLFIFLYFPKFNFFIIFLLLANRMIFNLSSFFSFLFHLAHILIGYFHEQTQCNSFILLHFSIDSI